MATCIGCDRPVQFPGAECYPCLAAEEDAASSRRDSASAYGVMANLERDSKPVAAPAGHLLPADRVAAFLFAGRARFTLVSKVTGARFTYEVEAKEVKGGESAKGPFFVRVLTGSNNESDYSFLGTVFADRGPAFFAHGKKSRIGRDAPSAKAFAWFFAAVSRGRVPETVEVWHQGRCGRCSRALTVPSSIEIGLGPECASRMGG